MRASAVRRDLIVNIRRSPSLALLIVQFLALLLYPLADGSRVGQVLTSAISVGVLGAAVWMVHRSPRSGGIAMLLSALGVGLWIGHNLGGSVPLGIAGSVFYAAAYFYAAYSLVAYMLADERTTADEMWAAAATFMLFVEAYAWVFMALVQLQPEAFSAPAKFAQEHRTWLELLFLSGTNFSATGLGDILPVTPAARMLVVIEQWNGVMYLAVVVARLAGLLKSKSG